MLYKKVIITINCIWMILLFCIAWKIGVFTAVFQIEVLRSVINNNYFCGVTCSIVAVIIMYKWQVWYSKRKLKQDFRCNECISELYEGIQKYNEYASSIPSEEDLPTQNDFQIDRKKKAQRYVDFYKNNKGIITIANICLSYEGNDLLLESIQSCFFINLNFKLLGIVNNIKNRLPNLRNSFPKIESLFNEYNETTDETIVLRLGELLSLYFIDVRFMAEYWMRLLDYLEYDPTYINLFVEEYNTTYSFENEMKLPLKERLKHIKGLEGQVNKKYVKQKFKDFWKF